jgi:hypothetical protein
VTTPTVSKLVGRLVVSEGDKPWGYLQVPQALLRGLFLALNQPGKERPDHRAHITVFTSDEIDRLGGPGAIEERGRDFEFSIGPVKAVNPVGWPEMSKVWFVTASSPALRKLRASYGLTPLVKGGHPFHITFAVRRTKMSKASSIGTVGTLLRSNSEPSLTDKYGQLMFKAAQESGTIDPRYVQSALGAVGGGLIGALTDKLRRGNRRDEEEHSFARRNAGLLMGLTLGGTAGYYFPQIDSTVRKMLISPEVSAANAKAVENELEKMKSDLAMTPSPAIQQYTRQMHREDIQRLAPQVEAVVDTSKRLYNMDPTASTFSYDTASKSYKYSDGQPVSPTTLPAVNDKQLAERLMSFSLENRQLPAPGAFEVINSLPASDPLRNRLTKLPETMLKVNSYTADGLTLTYDSAKDKFGAGQGASFTPVDLDKLPAPDPMKVFQSLHARWIRNPSDPAVSGALLSTYSLAPDTLRPKMDASFEVAPSQAVAIMQTQLKERPELFRDESWWSRWAPVLNEDTMAELAKAKVIPQAYDQLLAAAGRDPASLPADIDTSELLDDRRRLINVLQSGKRVTPEGNVYGGPPDDSVGWGTLLAPVTYGAAAEGLSRAGRLLGLIKSRMRGVPPPMKSLGLVKNIAGSVPYALLGDSVYGAGDEAGSVIANNLGLGTVPREMLSTGLGIVSDVVAAGKLAPYWNALLAARSLPAAGSAAGSMATNLWLLRALGQSGSEAMKFHTGGADQFVKDRAGIYDKWSSQPGAGGVARRMTNFLVDPGTTAAALAAAPAEMARQSDQTSAAALGYIAAANRGAAMSKRLLDEGKITPDQYNKYIASETRRMAMPTVKTPWYAKPFKVQSVETTPDEANKWYKLHGLSTH